MTAIIPASGDEIDGLPALPATIMPALAQLLQHMGIPRDVLASDEEITCAWRDLPRELRNLPKEVPAELIARMCVAVSSGLLDGAVNYAWNASILKLRDKIRTFGLPAVSQILQKDFEEQHLISLQDSELLDLSHKLNILSDDGFFFLDQCRDIRNNFSAAHPALGSINDREFINFLNRCIRYAMADASSPQGVDMGQFITAIRGARFTDDQQQAWLEKLQLTHAAQRGVLIGMAHGMYCDPAMPETGRLNALALCGALAAAFPAAVKSDLIKAHWDYRTKGDEGRYKASLQFFERLGLLNLLTEGERHVIFKRAISGLWLTHLAMNNFYNEHPYAERLLDLTRADETPETAQEEFVQTVVGCFIGEGYGVCWAAKPYYVAMIQEFSPREISTLLRLTQNKSIIQERTARSADCRSRCAEALELIDPTSLPASAKAEYEATLKSLRASG